VERDDQLSMLERMKCDMYQGYLFSRPLSKADFEQWLKTPRALTIPHAS
jgi:EAL domain-containing protein (putative c-di-GMP-specific phosphodiesterase class I)